MADLPHRLQSKNYPIEYPAVSDIYVTNALMDIVGGAESASELEYCAPCGICRQVMREFCEPKTFEVIVAKSSSEYQVYTLEELLPMSFRPENLGK